MILYFTDRHMNVLGQASTHLPEGLRVSDDLKTEEVEAGVATLEFTLNYTEKTRKEASRYGAVGNYILRKNGEEEEFYTIITSEENVFKQEVEIYAEDAGMDLLNETVGAYAADKAYPASYYVEKFSYDSGFEVGLNEVSNLNRKLSWEGETTASERILSVATQFDAEVSYSFEIDRLRIRHKYINLHKKRGTDSGRELRINREINNIIVKSSVEDLATALSVTGGYPEESETPITLKGYKYDDGDIYLSGSTLYSRSAVAKWSRYLSEKGNGTGHIVQSYSYDTTSQSELCNRAVSKLKKIYDAAVSYEVELAYLPDGIRIGDTVNVVDDAGELYLSARIMKLESSAANDEYTATLGDYKAKSSGISDKMVELAAQFEKLAQNRTFYTWVVFGDSETGSGISLNSSGKKYMGIAYNQTTKQPALTDPGIYSWVKVAGDQGIAGAPGKDGLTSFFHVRYADVLNPAASQLRKDTGKYIGTYVDFTAADSADPAKYTWSRFQGIQGEKGTQGIPGTNGVNGRTSYLHIKYSNDGGKTFTGNSGEDSGTYIGTCVDYTQNDPTNVSAYSWAKIKGETGAKGDKGDTGASGKGVKSTAVTYQASSSGTTIPTGVWSATHPATSADKPYFWTRTIITYTDNTTSTAYNVGSTPEGIVVGGRNLLVGTHKSPITYTYPTSGYSDKCSWKTTVLLNGNVYTLSFWAKSSVNGDKIRVHFYNPSNIISVVGSQGQRSTACDGLCDFVLTTTMTKYWVTYTIPKGGNSTRSVIIPRLGLGVTGTGTLTFQWEKLEEGNMATDWTPAPEDYVSFVDVEYYLSTSATSLSGGSWSTTAPTWVNGKYMWSRTVTTDGAGNRTYSPNQNGVCIAGAQGATGAKGDKGDTGGTGATGKGVKSIVEQYYKSTSATAMSGGSWSTTYPGWENSKYIWTRSVITYTDNTTSTTTAVCVTGSKGDKGATGGTGPTGNGIKSITEHYAVSTSNSSAPTTWSTAVPTMTETNKYLWNYETITYTNNTTNDTAKRVIGVYGNKGATGEDGKNGTNLWVNPLFESGKPQITRIDTSVTAPNGAAVNILDRRDHQNSSTAFPVFPGHQYRITVHRKRITGSLELNSGIWYITRTSGNAYDTIVAPTSTKDLGNSWQEATYNFTCPSGKSKGSVYFQIEQQTNNITTKWYIANVICVDITGLKGDTGAKGDKGDKGATGPQGPQGAAGKDANQVVHTVNGNGESNLYVEFATIKITGSYANQPTTFKLGGRGFETTDVQFSFISANNSDPGLDFLRSSGGWSLWIYKKTTSTWGLITRLNEPYGQLRVFNYTQGSGPYTVTWTSTKLASLPSGSINANPLQAAKTATNFMQFTDGTGLEVGNKTSGSWSGYRTKISASAFEILNRAGTTLAYYGDKLIQLGKNAKDAVIELCGGVGKILVETKSGNAALSIQSEYVDIKGVHESVLETSSSSGSCIAGAVDDSFVVNTYSDANNKANFDMGNGSIILESKKKGYQAEVEFYGCGWSGGVYTGAFAPTKAYSEKIMLGDSGRVWERLIVKNSPQVTSDRRAKTNIFPLGESKINKTDIHSELFDRLKPVQYRMIDGDGRICYGFVAQDVVEAMRELGIREDELDLVHHDRKNTEDSYIDTYSMVYTNLIAIITHELQLEKQRRSNLEIEVADLRSELESMRDNISGDTN